MTETQRTWRTGCVSSVPQWDKVMLQEGPRGREGHKVHTGQGCPGPHVLCTAALFKNNTALIPNTVSFQNLWPLIGEDDGRLDLHKNLTSQKSLSYL